MLKFSFFMAVFTAAMTTSLFAEANCNTVVVDNANIFNGQTQKIDAAAQNLSRNGADVRVRTFKTMGLAATLEYVEQSLEAECASWRAPDGRRKDNLIVLLISVDEHKTALYYGSQWKSVLDPHQTRIQTNFMNPHFKQRDFTGGFESGLNEIERKITVAAETSLDFGSLWTALYWVFSLCIFVGIVFLVVRTIQKKEKRAEARHRAILADQRVSSLLVELNSEYTGFEALHAGTKEARRVKSILDSVAESYARLKSLNSGDPDHKHSTAEYLVIAGEYTEMRRKLDEAFDVMKGRRDTTNSSPISHPTSQRSYSRASAGNGNRVKTRPPTEQSYQPHHQSHVYYQPVVDHVVYVPINQDPNPPVAPSAPTERNYSSQPDSGGGSSTSWDAGSSSSFDAGSSGGGGSDSSW